MYVHWSQPPAGVEDAVDVTYRYSSPHSSFTSDECTAYCHPHELIFRTTSSPINATTYSILRRATIRTLSCEQLPCGLSCGALSFADPVDGHTIAWKFRVPDPYARGCQRHYALIALCGQDPIRSHKKQQVQFGERSDRLQPASSHVQRTFCRDEQQRQRTVTQVEEEQGKHQ